MADNAGALDHITVKGFRSIKCLEEVELRPVNVLVGPNGSGKSNFVEVLAFLHALRQGKLVDYVDRHGGADNLLHFGSKETEEIELRISFRAGVNGYHVCLSPTAEDRLYVRDERCWFWNKEGHPDRPYEEPLISLYNEAGISQPQQRVAAWVQHRLDGWRTYHFHDTSDSSPVKKTADVDDNRFLRSDGSNLAAYLHFLRDYEPAAYQLIRGAVQRVAPFLADFQLEPLRRNESKIRLEWTHKSSDRYFDVASLSDGTLRFLCLATLFLQPVTYRPSVIVVDEPELGLHPYAIAMLAALVKTAATETQVIVSTQSPLLLDHFEPEDVLVTELTGGATTLRRLDPKDLQDWLTDYSLGQLWEKNELGGRPQHG
jgi:predicted ATPase